MSIFDIPFDDEEYMKSKTPFYAVVTNIKTGEPEYVQIKSVFNNLLVIFFHRK